MSEHRIRLRGGWELHDCAAPDARPSRLTLPVVWGPSPARRGLRLVRRFQAPSAPGASLSLEIEDAWGLRAAALNGEPLAFDASKRGRIVVSLRSLQDRNELVLDVELAGEERPAETAQPWGRVALLISDSQSPREGADADATGDAPPGPVG